MVVEQLVVRIVDRDVGEAALPGQVVAPLVDQLQSGVGTQALGQLQPPVQLDQAPVSTRAGFRAGGIGSRFEVGLHAYGGASDEGGLGRQEVACLAEQSLSQVAVGAGVGVVAEADRTAGLRQGCLVQVAPGGGVGLEGEIVAVTVERLVQTQGELDPGVEQTQHWSFGEVAEANAMSLVEQLIALRD